MFTDYNKKLLKVLLRDPLKLKGMVRLKTGGSIGVGNITSEVTDFPLHQ